jgi:hypothetical protein
MIEIEEFVNKRLKGQPSIYSAEKHITLLRNTFSEGKDICTFCKEADIGRTTFYNWIKKHKEFREAFEILLNYAKSYWMAKADEPGINHSVWLYMMKTRFNPHKDYCKQTCLKGLSKCKTNIEMVRVILNKVADGELTTEEGSVWMDLIGKAIKTEDVTALFERAVNLEKQLKERNYAK